jgi:ubiquinone/menaquinone biosynthesis C-methylase UbiE
MDKNISTFNVKSDEYVKNRPLYPSELYQFLFANCIEMNSAWDCGCGNGQVSIGLVSKFNSIEASDINENQIVNSYKHDKIHYSIQRSEKTTFSDKYFDLICTAQCLHWFDLDMFFHEAKRVLKPNGLFGCWGYGFFKVNCGIDEMLNEKLFSKIDPFWSSGNRIVQNGYKDIKFPFNNIPVPKIDMIMQWDNEQLMNYLNTWSAVKLYNDKFNADIIKDIEPLFEKNLNYVENVIFDFSFYCGRNQL